jgi:hypothetical protein
LAFAGLMVLLVWGSSVGASTVLKLDLQSLVANSDRVLVGDVSTVESYREDGRIFTRVELEVVEEWKEESRADKVTLSYPGGRIGEMATRVHGMPNFRQRERVVVFLEEYPNRQDFGVTGLQQGKFQVALGPDGQTNFVVPRLGGLQLLEQIPSVDETGEPAADTTKPPPSGKISAGQLRSADPAPIHSKVFTLDDFRSRVTRVIDEQRGDD